MSLFRSSVRPPAVMSDEAVERYLSVLRAHVDPDPAFRRRLRGVVLNQFVAMRESSAAGLVPRTMGRLGRSVLYASFALGVSVTGVMAASEIAVPGDVLYPLKRAIEDLRVDVLPPHFEDELVIYELNERLAEIAVLVEREDKARVEALADEVVTDYASVIAEAAVDGDPLDRRTEVLTSLLARMPADARAAIDRALAAPAAIADPAAPADRGSSDGEDPAPKPDPRGGGADSGSGQGNSSEHGSTNGSGNSASGGGGAGKGTGPGTGNGTAGQQGTGSAGGGDEPDDLDAPTATPDASSTPKPKKSPKP